MVNYATLNQVRRMADLLPNIVTIGDDEATIDDGDGSKTTFYIPSGFIVDANGDESVTIADLTVYVSSSSVTISSVDAEKRSFTLAAAPGNGLAIAADFYWSSIPDSEILGEIEHFSNMIDKRTDTLFSAANSKTQKWDGNGIQKRFTFDKFPVTSITSITVDSDTSYVEDTDYWLYPESARASYIDFLFAPLCDKKNISITYQYGETNAIVNQWVALRSAASIVRYMMGKKGKVGFYNYPSGDGRFPSKSDSFSLYKTLTDEADELENHISKLMILELVG